MPQFAIRSKENRRSRITDKLLKRYEKYVQSIDDRNFGVLKFRESEDISLARKALRLAGDEMDLDLIIRRPRGFNELQFRLRDKKGSAVEMDRYSPRTERTIGHQGDLMAAREKSIKIWGLDRSEIDRIFDGSNSVVDKWRQHGVLPDAIAALDATTDLLCRYLKQDRIPNVVRRPIPARDEVSLIKMLKQGDSKTLLATCRDMFRFEQVHA